MKFTLGLLSCLLLSLTLSAAEPVFYMPLDGSADVVATENKSVKPGVVYGRSDYLPAIVGAGLNVTRHAYDQVTAINFSELPKIDCNSATVSFWFKPEWKEDDSESHPIFNCSFAKGLRCYLVKSSKGFTDLSVCAPGQVQVLKKNLFKQNEWVHVAFTWDTENGEVVLYLKGREAGRRIDKTRFQKITEPQSPNIWLGRPGSDRFQANVGNGLYDEIKIFNQVLSPEDIFALSSAGTKEEMVALPLSELRTVGEKTEFVFTYNQIRTSGPLTLLTLIGNRPECELTMTAMGASGKISIHAKTDKQNSSLESNYVLNLKQAHRITFEKKDNHLLVYLDGALQGEIELPFAFGCITSVQGIEGVSLQPVDSCPSEEQVERIANAATSKLEKSLWSLTDAQSVKHGVRERICLNGYWRVIPVNEYSYAPPAGKWGYMRVPGSFRSPLYKIYRDDNGSLVPEKEWAWNNESLIKYRAGWYQRTFHIPANFPKNSRIFLNFANLNSDYGRVYLNGKLVDSFRQDFKYFTVIPNRRRIDVTDFLAKDGDNILTLFLDRFFVGLWHGVPSIGDHQEIALDDVWLENAPAPTSLINALAFPSFRTKEVTLRTRINNPEGIKGKGLVRFAFQHDEESPVLFTKEIQLDGTGEQLVVFTEKWENPVLWDVENPELYKMTVSLNVNGAEADTLPPINFGFREMWVGDGELCLNGRKIRLRMLSSPGLDRVRSYYGTPKTVGQYVAHIKSLNYDTVRDNPFRKSSQVGRTEFLNESDRQGLYNLFPMPPYEDEELEQYSKDVLRFLEHYGNHPSILMWYTDFNTCGSWTQDPAMLNNTDYYPEAKRHPRQRAQTAETVMRAIDPSRELFQHAGGNSGKIFGSMNYQSFGVPLQEQEDWPKQWSEKHTQPLMSVESSFPYKMQYVYFDDFKQGSLVAEHAARYFGDSVFSNEKTPIPNFDFWYQSPYKIYPENMLDLSTMLYRHVVKSWRAYDMSALGDFPGTRDLSDTAIHYNHHNVVYEVNDDVKTAGLKPDNPVGTSETQRHLLTDYSKPTALHEIVRESFDPLLIFLGGMPKDFTNKDHAFFAGETFQKSIVVVNDHSTPQKIGFKWELTLNEKQITAAHGELSVTVAPSGIEKLPINLVAPNIYKRTEATLHLMALKNDVLIKEDSLNLEFFPKRTAVDFGNVNAGLYDPEGKTGALLKKAGFPFCIVSTLDQVKKCSLLIIGQNALGDANPELLRQVEQENLIEKGLKILIFEQKSCNLCNFVFESPSARNAFIRRPNSRYLTGLESEDFSNWRGSSDTVPAYVLSDEHSRHYPHSKWKCGNGGIVSGNVIRKPSYGNFTTIVDCGFNLMFASLLELRKGHGLVLFCQLDVTSRYFSDPVATKLTDKILTEMSTPFVPVGSQRVAYIGNTEGEKILQRMGVEYARISLFDIWKISSCQVLILGQDAVPEKDHEKFRKFVANEKRSTAIVAMPGAQLDLLPGNLKTEKMKIYKVSAPKDDPIFSGIPNADLYFRREHEVPILTSAPNWIVATKPALFAKLDLVTGAVVVLNISPDDIDGLWNSEKVSRVWSTIFSNMNIGLGKDLKLFTCAKSRHNTVRYCFGRAIPENCGIKFDPHNNGTVEDDKDFVPVKLGASWESQGFQQENPVYKYPDNAPAKLKQPYEGYAWVRCKVNIPESWKGHCIRLVGGPVDDCDWTYFNGQKIGETTFETNPEPYYTKRNYLIPPHLVNFGAENTLVIHIFDRWGSGGVTGKLEVIAEDSEAKDAWSPYIDDLNFYDVDAFHNW